MNKQLTLRGDIFSSELLVTGQKDTPPLTSTAHWCVSKLLVIDELLLFGNRRDVVARPSSFIVRSVLSLFSAIVCCSQFLSTSNNRVVVKYCRKFRTPGPYSNRTTTATISVINAD
ncbi:unnamed protein product [Macrosiphum euphorbiae]|nr:unnamed protein product [Macrosiphum euphorbiae]